MKTFKDYLEEGGVKGKSFIDNYNNPGNKYTVVEICPPAIKGELNMKIFYEKMPSTTAVAHHLDDLEAKVQPGTVQVGNTTVYIMPDLPKE